MPKLLIFPSDLSATPQTPCPPTFRLKDIHREMFQPKNILQENQFPKNRKNTNPAEGFQSPAEEFPSPILQPEYRWAGHLRVNPEKPDVPLNKNDAFQKVQKRRVQEKRWARSYSAWSKPTVFLSLEPSLNGFKISFKSHCRFKIIPYLYAMLGCYTWHFIRLRVQHHVCIFSLIVYACTKLRFPAFLEWAADKWVSVHPVAQF